MPESVLNDLFSRCIFCGHIPDRPTEEHPIPRWLIRMTGKMDRAAYFGKVHRPGQQPKLVGQPWGRFNFPACEICNKTFGLMEEMARPAVEQLSSSGALTTYQIEDLIDWLDKLRLGCWLSQLHMEQNRYQIKPKFFINDMVGRCDSFLWVFVARESFGFLNAITGGPEFVLLPSSFAIFINNVAIVQYSETAAGRTILPEVQSSDTTSSPVAALEAAEIFSRLSPSGWPVAAKRCGLIFRPRQRSYLGDGNLNDERSQPKGFYRLARPLVYHVTRNGLDRINEGFLWSNIVWDDSDEMRLEAVRTLYRLRKDVIARVSTSNSNEGRLMRSSVSQLLSRFEAMSAADLTQFFKNRPRLSITISPEA
jgi:hypothetical protein